jgi:hypothetical protein
MDGAPSNGCSTTTILAQLSIEPDAGAGAVHTITAIRACGLAGGQVARGMKKISYKGYRFPAEIIQQAIWLYVRFTLSFRDVGISTRSI